MAFSVRRKQNVNVGKVAIKIVVTIIGLYVSGTLMTQVGNVMNGTMSPFYPGLSLIGWTVGLPPTNGTAGIYPAQSLTGNSCAALANTAANWQSGSPANTCITDVSSSTGILSVIGIIAIASIVTEFVEFKF